MIHFDRTKADAARHRSGLTRVSDRLAAGLGAEAQAVQWADWDLRVRRDDWFVTAELFSEAERPGFTAFLDSRACRTAAVFHDAIPLKHPHITWPQSVARHPGYMKLLARFDRVLAVSAASKEELEGFWRWLGLERTPPVAVLPLGADFNGEPRVTRRTSGAAVPQLLSVGIIEPRKNQALLLDGCERLWSEGLRFELHLAGRVNPHFGRPIARRARALARRHPLHVHESPDDRVVAGLYRTVRATVFPSIAEGCGLPLIESLWMGVPCVCSDLPVLRENADGGGCLPVASGDVMAWINALRQVLTDDALLAQLADQATSRPLPTWTETARRLRDALR
ncbi:MAG TPA: glycosyltransferase [Opitutaceae bacterium]|nr:glycosyltransferase [Opitutaceae bacterium]